MTDGPGDALERLAQRLRGEGMPEAVIAAALAEGRLPGLAVEAALGGRGRHSLSWTAQKAGVPAPYLREVLRAAGRPHPGRGELAFTDDDLEFARVVRILLDAGLPRRELVEVIRVTSQGISQAAAAMLTLLGDALLEPGDTEEELGVRYADAAHELSPLIPQWVGYLVRAHLRDGVKDTLITEAERRAGSLSATREVGVGFADLVGYTRLGERLATEDVGRIASRLAALAAATVVPPARLVKTIGDAAMFVSVEVPALVRTVCDLRDALEAEGADMPPVRIGLAYGSATSRGGDWFGSTVNLASRITVAARPAQILATSEVVRREPGFAWKRRRRRHLKGVEGRVRLYSLEAIA
jgi:adenylate cyclase